LFFYSERMMLTLELEFILGVGEWSVSFLGL
jgi:hypothetical protein